MLVLPWGPSDKSDKVSVLRKPQRRGRRWMRDPIEVVLTYSTCWDKNNSEQPQWDPSSIGKQQ